MKVLSLVVVFATALSAPALAQQPTDAPAPANGHTPGQEALPSTPPPPVPEPPPMPPAPPAPPAAIEPKQVGLQLTSLRLMREKGLISQAEYDSAMRDLGESSGLVTPESNTVMLSRWSATLYGFVETDFDYDSTQSFNDFAGNVQVARPDTYAGQNGRVEMGVRNSRIGFKIRAPETHGVRASAMLEMDFLGNQNGQQPTATEAQFFTNPLFRIRHFNLKLETPVVDILIGQYWKLLGWQSVFHPNTVEIQGVPGQLYSRDVQVRVSKTIKSGPILFEAAVAMLRPPQRNSMKPAGEAGIRFGLNNWTGVTTAGSTGTSIQPLSIAVTGDLRSYTLPEFSATPKTQIDSSVGGAYAIDAFIPVLPGRKNKMGNSLSLNGEFAQSWGGADQYTALNGGVAFAALPNPTMATPAPTFTPDVDNGLVVYSADGTLHLIQWTSYLFGLQYYLPGTEGRFWISGNYSHMDSNNSKNHGDPKKVRSSMDWADANLFVDVTKAVRLGAEYAWFFDTYVDGTDATNHRFQFSAFYIF